MYWITVATTCGNADLPCSFTLGEISKLNRDASTALATIREWMNSLVLINRVPLDVLSLIPTHLPYQEDRFRATFVCRHWRRTFLQIATLWSHLHLSKGKAYVEAILKRTKSSPLSVLASDADPVGTVELLLPHTKQIADLKSTNNYWADAQRFLYLDSEPLPLLRTLKIDIAQEITADDLEVMTAPSQPLFSGAVDLKEFRSRSVGLPLLSHFVFPNLTSFDLWATSAELFCGAQLLNFLEASPMLQAVRVKIVGTLSLEGVPRERVVVLRYVENLCLAASDGGPVYELATHISCPSVKNTSLTYMGEGGS